MAIEQGADVIECDVVLTSDGAAICRHEPWLSNTTDALTVSSFLCFTSPLLVDLSEPTSLLESLCFSLLVSAHNRSS